MTTSTATPVIRLHRPWAARFAQRVAEAWARLRAGAHRLRERWRERRAHDDALDLDEATLRDMGAPLWLQEEARFRREARRFERALMQRGVDRY